MSKYYLRENTPLLRKILLMQASYDNDNSLLKAGDVDPVLHISYGELKEFQELEGVHQNWHQRVVNNN